MTKVRHYRWGQVLSRLAAFAIGSSVVLALATGARCDDTEAQVFVANGGFEQPRGDTALPDAWYFLQQALLVESPDAPEGRRCLEFKNATPGRAAEARQHFALDGRQVRAIDASLWIQFDNVAPGQALVERPALRIRFYDERVEVVGEAIVGPFSGTSDWTRHEVRVAVPPDTRIALITIGLGGGTGRATFDAIAITPASAAPGRLPPRLPEGSP